jgi:hypothetical protein
MSAAMKRRSAAHTLAALDCNDPELLKVAARVDAVHYRVLHNRVLCWTEEQDVVMRTFSVLDETPRDVWTIKRNKKGEIGCSCPAWRFPKLAVLEDGRKIRAPRTCKHLQKLEVDSVRVP